MENAETNSEDDTVFHRDYFRRRVIRLKRRPTSRCLGIQRELAPRVTTAVSCTALETSRLQLVHTEHCPLPLAKRIKPFLLRHGIVIVAATMWATAVFFAAIMARQEILLWFGGAL